MSGSRAWLAWCKRTWPSEKFVFLRVLGWSSWFHIMGWAIDINLALLTSGCYIFALVPSSYSTDEHSKPVLDIVELLIHAAATKNCQAFSSVPWVLEEIAEKWAAADSGQRLVIEEALCAFKTYYVGGARASATCVSWAKELALPVVFGIGMTETGMFILSVLPFSVLMYYS